MKLLISLCALSALCLAAMGEEVPFSACRQSGMHENNHTFGLASLKEEDLTDHGAEAMYKKAAEVCYQECNAAELMSLSSNYWKHRSPVTLLDRAATFLMESDFLQEKETYFVNHMAGDEEGPSGLECLVMESPTEFSLYPANDAACGSTRTVICGLSGTTFTPTDKPVVDPDHSANNTIGDNNNNGTSGTVNPEQDKNKPVINISSGFNTADALDRATSNDGKYGGNNNGTQVVPNNLTEEQQVPSDEEEESQEEEEEEEETQAEEPKQNEEADLKEPDQEVDMMDKDDTVKTTGATEDDLVYPLTIGDLKYKVIRLQKNHQTTESASTMCQTHHDKIGSLYSLSIPNFSAWFQRVHPIGKTIIGSWNGDSYGAKSNQCLTYSVSQGVHLSSCNDASVLLCESTLLAEDQ